MSLISNIYASGGRRVILREVGLRDGLQMVKNFPTLHGKKQWLSEGVHAGIRHFEVGSFLPPARYPQFADVRDLISHAGTHDNVYCSALTMNERAIIDAAQTSVNEIVCVVSSTQEHSQANMRCSRKQAINLIRMAKNIREAEKRDYVITAAIPMAFGCSISGAVSKETILGLIERCIDAGADVISIADTVGFAGPKQITDLSRDVVKLCGKIPVILHLHDTRGMAISNAAAALDCGVEILDGSLGGLGGCPYAPGATGNVVLEDLVFLCERMGFQTYVDIEKLVEVRMVLMREMPKEKLYGALARAGPPQNIQWRA